MEAEVAAATAAVVLVAVTFGEGDNFGGCGAGVDLVLGDRKSVV